MTPPAELAAAALVHAEVDLVRVQGKVDAARAVLVRLLQDLVVAESRLSNHQSAQLVEANEALVLAALRSQTAADTAAVALDEAVRTAELDPLTQLPNRVLLLDRLGHAMAGAERHGGKLALLFLDLDQFKQINDTLGHVVGDEVLKLVAQRAASAIRAADTVSRHGGDEFLILLSEVSTRSDAALAAAKVIAAIAAPSTFGGRTLQLQSSIGISLYPDDGIEAKALIARADEAMYRAKRKGGGEFAFHGETAAGGAAPALAMTPLHPASRHDQALSAHELHHAQLREANEQLLLAALSARELQAAAEQAQQRQAEFMAVVAQELRNPQAPIRIATAMLGRSQTDEPLLPRMQAIVQQQMARMSRLVGDLLDVSGVSAASIRLALKVVNMAAVAELAVAACKPLMDARRQHCSLQLPASPSAADVRGDPERLAQVVGNLLDNASKYTPDGGEIALSVQAAGDSLVLTVADNGIGITAQALPQVFEPFAQDAHAMGYNGISLGIGLTVVRALVLAHGGSIVAHSAGSGRGSRFVVMLPRV